MIVELFVSLSLAQASPTQAQVLQRGERIGAWSVVLKLCKAADYTIDPAPAEADLWHSKKVSAPTACHQVTAHALSMSACTKSLRFSDRLNAKAEPQTAMQISPDWSLS